MMCVCVCCFSQANAFDPAVLTSLLHRMMPKFKETLVEQLLKKETLSE